MVNTDERNAEGVKMNTKNLKIDKTHKWNRVVKKYYIYAVLLLIVIVFSVMKLDEVTFFGRGHFLSPASITNLLRSAVPILTLSGAFTLLMISGNIDLSVGSAMSLNAVVYSLMILNGFSMGIAFILTLILGIFCGFINGYIVQKLRITPVIATLVTLNLFKGVALLIVPNGVSAIKGTADKVMPIWINDYARKKVLLGLPTAFYVAILVIVLLIITQRKTILGKYAVAVGGNRTAAELSGINARQVAWLLYILVGFMAALAGIARASYMSTGNPLSGDGMELDNIIAVLLGGTAFAGGEGSVAKTMVGALIIMCVTTGLMTVIPPYWQSVAKGTVLVIAVVLNKMLIKTGVEA
ncbi:ABC transporter permease [Oceanispirochaeta sp.]|jgi:ribose/xylose/arabinose/galactoside ABC-type transport system permease subunit|uniref:ABC transporter permease n=1 Tax=Oceanispirochaeta sp. TaxID=2035350 RepID=UPI002629FA88|nr:ABC transporter permease [Oceanispirochaeta sp.]MDA3958413.1 ABC transporter permease [Oceanispirochaeta sp.]